MTVDASDGRGGEGGPIRGREARAWANLVRSHGMLDTFQVRDGQLRFSWDNHQLHRHNPATGTGPISATRILRRLDRIYAPQYSRAFPCKVSSRILSGFALSDHAPVLASIRGEEFRRRPSRLRMSVAHLGQPLYRERISEMWNRQVAHGEAQGWAADKVLVNCLVWLEPEPLIDVGGSVGPGRDVSDGRYCNPD